MATQFDWNIPPLAPEDQQLVDAYVEVGRSVDSLAYTPDFDRLCALLGFEDPDDAKKNEIYRRLMRIRKAGRLPGMGIRPQ